MCQGLFLSGILKKVENLSIGVNIIVSQLHRSGEIIKTY